MKLPVLICIIWFTGLPLTGNAITNAVICFETDSLFIKTDTTAFFQLTDKRYSYEHAQLIRTEICYRLKTSANNEALMNGTNLSCYLDAKRRSYLASCLNYNECITLLKTGKAKVYYRYPLKEISNIKIKRTGSKLIGRVDRLYVDKSTGKSFYREPVYHHQWWKRHRGCEPWNLKKSK